MKNTKQRKRLVCFRCCHDRWDDMQPCDYLEAWEFKCLTCGDKRYFDVALEQDNEGHVFLDNIDTKPSFFNMSVTHWAEINEPEES